MEPAVAFIASPFSCTMDSLLLILLGLQTTNLPFPSGVNCLPLVHWWRPSWRHVSSFWLFHLSWNSQNSGCFLVADPECFQILLIKWYRCFSLIALPSNRCGVFPPDWSKKLTSILIQLVYTSSIACKQYALASLFEWRGSNVIQRSRATFLDGSGMGRQFLDWCYGGFSLCDRGREAISVFLQRFLGCVKGQPRFSTLKRLFS